MGVRGYFLKKRKLSMQNITRERSRHQQLFCSRRFFTIYLFLLLAKNHQKIQSGCLVDEFSFMIFLNDINHGYRAVILKKNYSWMFPFYMAVATYWYYKKVHRKMRTAIVSYLLKRPSPTNALLFQKIYYLHSSFLNVHLLVNSLYRPRVGIYQKQF